MAEISQRDRRDPGRETEPPAFAAPSFFIVPPRLRREAPQDFFFFRP